MENGTIFIGEIGSRFLFFIGEKTIFIGKMVYASKNYQGKCASKQVICEGNLTLHLGMLPEDFRQQLVQFGMF